MINEKCLELLLLLGITEKMPYDKKSELFLYQDKKYDVNIITNRIYNLVTEFMKDYEKNDVTESTEKSE